MNSDGLDYYEEMKASLYDALHRGNRLGSESLSDPELAKILARKPPNRGYLTWWLVLLLLALVLVPGWILGIGIVHLLLDFLKFLQLIDGWSPNRSHDIAAIAVAGVIFAITQSFKTAERRRVEMLYRDIKKLAFAVRKLPWNDD